MRDGQRSAARFHGLLALSTFLQVGVVLAAGYARQLLAECETELAAV